MVKYPTLRRIAVNTGCGGGAWTPCQPRARSGRPTMPAAAAAAEVARKSRRLTGIRPTPCGRVQKGYEAAPRAASRRAMLSRVRTRGGVRRLRLEGDSEAFQRVRLTKQRRGRIDAPASGRSLLGAVDSFGRLREIGWRMTSVNGSRHRWDAPTPSSGNWAAPACHASLSPTRLRSDATSY